ncbi:GGDEF domain-containing protein [Alteromonas sp. H39]|uniref:GGDEF domain-containing protein n=1 Tax=Alteromonas sp. H39 TaxID=3389876 RepID=UPI0039E130DD
MGIEELVVFQGGLLTLVALIGIAFTFALPKPKHKHKSKAAHYARLFLVFTTLAQITLSLRHVGYREVYILCYNLFLLFSAWLVFISVAKRYGHAVRGRYRYAIASHLLIVELLTVHYYWNQDSVMMRDALMLFNCAIPLMMTLSRIRHYLNRESIGNWVLMLSLLVALFITLVGGPLYLFVFVGSSEQQTMVGLISMVSLQLLFLLGFAVSIMYSLLERLRLRVFTDALTGAKNRHFYYEMAPKLCAYAERQQQTLSVVVCDIDHFKSINDRYGHLAGDYALKHFSRVVQSLLRKEDTLIRMGGGRILNFVCAK